jgi:hypothetical protein
MTLNPILHSLDQTTEFAVVSNTVIDAQITLATPTAPVLTARVADLDLNWAFAANALFGDLGDNGHKLWQGNFTGSGKTDERRKNDQSSDEYEQAWCDESP